ncbi:outer membrane beta-barrel protein [Cesiribacter sp. SM1]|uniref:outer membrane beta-barrel protein n=1 Tax=Cesiribacter sp. SM1 TaxID=2861196 RepID=UPI001CD32D07|nr:outer membrane beta-barrel protein [Cesiribacter sp. SM1]
MKKFLILCLMVVSLASYAQEGSKNSFGVMAGAGSAIVAGSNLEGGPDLDLERNFELGAHYYRQIGEKVKFETGIFYHYSKLTETSAFYPGIPQITTQYDIHLLYLPAFLRYNISPYFFINGGLMADIDLSNNMGVDSSRNLNSQSGAGVGFGIGGELSLFNSIYLQLNPYMNLHGVLLVQRENNPGRILDAGIRLGIRTR